LLSLSKKAYAKVNLFLEIIEKRSDAYHELKTIFQTVSLADELIFEKTENGISLNCSDSNLPCDESNLVYKAVKLIKEFSGYKKGISIILKKNIPTSAGLGGGSSDAASTIKGLNKIWGLNLTYPHMVELAAHLGSDVPFFLTGGTVIAEGRGEKLISFLPTPEMWIVILKPEISISTRWAYEQWNSSMKINCRCKIEDLINSITQHNLAGRNLLFNSFEDIIEKHYPVIKTIKEKLNSLSIEDHLLSGSGSCVFALTGEEKLAKKIKGEFENTDIKCFITKTIKSYGIRN
jgi:4-diphosphocytidyl-2-C-methyl-D-erythritol kinase